MLTSDQYSLINPLRFSPSMIAKRKEFRCEHRHNGLYHPRCYDKANGIEERKGFLDIEAGGLDADFDIMLSWCIYDHQNGIDYYDHITKADMTSGLLDQRIVETLVSTMWKFDRVVTHYGSRGRYDVPFIRARYLWLLCRNRWDGMDFPQLGYMWQSDTYSMAKVLLKIHSRRQGSVANTVVGKDEKTRIDPEYWMLIKYGTKEERTKAIEYIVDHNIHDAHQLYDNYKALVPYIKETRTSI